MKFRIPQKIKIGPHDYEVSFVDDKDEDFIHENKNTIGCAMHHKLQIKLKSCLAPQQSWTTMWHEVIHVLSYQNNLELDEETVQRISNGVCTVLEDNKDEIFVCEKRD